MQNESVRDLELQADFDLFFEKLFEKVESGEMTYEQMDSFFPQDVKDRAKKAAG